ncbi:hypothetical protein FACS1894152_4940 [Bacilli bacterium]|nr:hypothetical protein FACS1894152_4940 [Bacilli bacterium]
MNNLIPSKGEPMNNLMSSELRKQLFSLNGLSTEELRVKWYSLFKTTPPCCNRLLFIKELAYRIQTLYYSDVPSDDELKQLGKVAKKKLLKNSGESGKVTILPPPGTVIRKTYRGSEYLIKILGDGNIECNGATYRSLSALAFKIAGTKWNGNVFFGLVQKKKELKALVEATNGEKDDSTAGKESNPAIGESTVVVEENTTVKKEDDRDIKENTMAIKGDSRAKNSKAKNNRTREKNSTKDKKCKSSFTKPLSIKPKGLL